MTKRLLRKAFRIFFRYQKKNQGPTLYEIKDRLDNMFDAIEKWCQALTPILATLTFAIFIYDVGFNSFYSNDILLYKLWRTLLIILVILLTWFFLLELRKVRKKRSRAFNIFLIALTWFAQDACKEVVLMQANVGDEYVFRKLALYGSTIILFFTEFSQVIQFIYHRGVNPAFLFVGSFFLLILTGALLLLLPNATHGTLNPVDAWFTSASAVCVTGLTVVDTATKFTHIGKLIILGLIQLGGLGVMTFAGLLSYLAAGTVSFKNQLALQNMLSSDQIGTVIAFVSRIIIVTFFFEGLGALFIYNSLDEVHFPSVLERIFFSIFHAISAFCNAGFSTYTNNLYELPVRFNYTLHFIIAWLIILGGIGFPVVFNVFNFLKANTLRVITKVLRVPYNDRYVHLLDTSAKIALATTSILLAFGFVAYLVLEQDASLKQHPTQWGKIVTSFFGSVTPRTAGFNTVDLTALTLPTIMIYLLLMWIGASPSGTGGGIKTTVIALAFLNVKSIVTGKERTEYSSVQIGENSLQRAFAIILLSLLVLGITILILSITEPDKQLFAIAFEAFSAFGTVGLTLGITADLSISSKILLSLVMLTGRVGTLTLLFAFVTPSKQLHYRYPKEDVSL